MIFNLELLIILIIQNIMSIQFKAKYTYLHILASIILTLSALLVPASGSTLNDQLPTHPQDVRSLSQQHQTTDGQPDEQTTGVLIMNEQTNIRDLMQEHQYLVVYFSENACQYCQSFMPRYLLMAELFHSESNQVPSSSKHQPATLKRHDVQFANMQYDAHTKQFFQIYGVEHVPILKVFRYGALLAYQFDELEDSETLVDNIGRWVSRIISGDVVKWYDGSQQNYEYEERLREREEGQILDESKEKQESNRTMMIVHCHEDKKYHKAWTEEYLEKSRHHLNIDFLCIDDHQYIGSNNFAVIRRHHSNLELITLPPTHKYIFQQTSFQESSFRKDVKDYLNKIVQYVSHMYIKEWSDQVIYQLFSRNESAFILIVNNESISENAYEAYENIKQNWNMLNNNGQKNGQYESIMFVKATLHRNLEEVTKLKRYLCGNMISYARNYPYPILAFLDMSQGSAQAKRYIFPINVEKTPQNIEQWIDKVNRIVIKKQPLLQAEGNLYPFFNQDTERMKEEQEDLTKISQAFIYLRTQSECLTVLSRNHRQPFFIFYIWRNQLTHQFLQYQLKQIWEFAEGDVKNQKNAGIKETLDIILEIRKHINLYVHTANSVDIPKLYGVQVDYFPSFYYFSAEKVISRLDGVTEITKIIEFITTCYKDHSSLQVSQNTQSQMEETNKLEGEISSGSLL